MRVLFVNFSEECRAHFKLFSNHFNCDNVIQIQAKLNHELIDKSTEYNVLEWCDILPDGSDCIGLVVFCLDLEQLKKNVLDYDTIEKFKSDLRALCINSTIYSVAANQQKASCASSCWPIVLGHNKDPSAVDLNNGNGEYAVPNIHEIFQLVGQDTLASLCVSERQDGNGQQLCESHVVTRFKQCLSEHDYENPRAAKFTVLRDFSKDENPIWGLQKHVSFFVRPESKKWKRRLEQIIQKRVPTFARNIISSTKGGENSKVISPPRICGVVLGDNEIECQNDEKRSDLLNTISRRVNAASHSQHDPCVLIVRVCAGAGSVASMQKVQSVLIRKAKKLAASSKISNLCFRPLLEPHELDEAVYVLVTRSPQADRSNNPMSANK